MPHQTSRRGEGKRGAVFTCDLALCVVGQSQSACRPVASASGCRLEQTAYPSAAFLISPPRDRPRPVSVCPGAMAFMRILSGASSSAKPSYSVSQSAHTFTRGPRFAAVAWARDGLVCLSVRRVAAEWRRDLQLVDTLNQSRR